MSNTRTRKATSAMDHHRTLPTARPPRLSALSKQTARGHAEGRPRCGTTANIDVKGSKAPYKKQRAARTPMVVCQS